MQIVLTEEQQEFLEKTSRLMVKDGATWMYMPFWFKKEANGKFQMVNYENLPDSVKAELRRLQKGKLSGKARYIPRKKT